MANIKPEKKKFLKYMAIVVLHLPKYYAVVFEFLYPEVDVNRLYSVVRRGVLDWDILRALIPIAKSHRDRKRADERRKHDRDESQRNIVIQSRRKRAFAA